MIIETETNKNMAEQERIHLCLDKKNLDFLDKVKQENYLSSRSKAMNYIMDQFKIMISDYNKYKNSKEEIKDLKSIVDSTNKDTKMLLELINGIYYKEDYGGIPAIEVNPSDAYQMTKERVENKIAKEHYNKSRE